MNDMQIQGEPTFISNSSLRKTNVKREIQAALQTCESFQISVAFITREGLSLLREELKELKVKNVKGRIITSTYLKFNKPEVFYDLLSYPNIEVRVYKNEDIGFHPKGYFFNRGVHSNIIVGSANITHSALTKNQEWNIQINPKNDTILYTQMQSEFEEQWKNSDPLTIEWIQQYEEVYKDESDILQKNDIELYQANNVNIKPNAMQLRALGSLQNIRESGKDRALLISATGTGKTYLSAFDVLEYKPKKLLFIVHRENIARTAMKSFARIIKNTTLGLYTGCEKDLEADYIFATVQTLSKVEHLNRFDPTYFDYIVVDEVHRAGSKTFQRVFDYFKPKFLLGMTATPERTDDFNIYQLFNYTIAYEIRLNDALENKFLCPFYYYGIQDLFVDDEEHSFSEFRYVQHEQRVDHVISQIKEYKFSGEKVRGLVFCSRKEEAKDFSNSFNKRGYRTVALTGENNEHEREQAIERIEMPECSQSLDYIFTVDIFNEGIDIPSLNQIVMLRETQSPIVFVQQLGRGLRKDSSKEYVVVIDFIGNYTNNYMIAVALSGINSYSKDDMRRFVSESDFILPGLSNVSFDQVSKERIFSSIDHANVSNLKFLKEQYSILKNKINRIPNMFDYEKYDSISVLHILDSKYGTSYHSFLKKVDADYSIVLSDRQELTLEFITRKLIKGKRIHEILCFDLLLTEGCVTKNQLDKLLFARYKKQLTDLDWNSLINILCFNFYISTFRDKYKEVKIIKVSNDQICLSEEFIDDIGNRDFSNYLKEILLFAKMQYDSKYSKTYNDTNFVLYEKYSYEDISMLLSWERDGSGTIFGYQYNELTNTLPVCINYHKEDDISDTTKYEDHFLSPDTLIAMSKGRRTMLSKDMQYVINSKENDTKIYLFVRKNKEDSSSKEFYFMGLMDYVSMIETKMLDEKTNICEITYKLEQSVRNDIYDFITSE